jgi:hypothetical protein
MKELVGVIMKINNNKIIFGIAFAVFVISILCFIQGASALVIRSVETSPSQVSPGGSATIEVTIKNDLDRDIKNLAVSLDLTSATIPFAPFGEGISSFVDKLDEDDSETFNFGIIASPDAATGVYKIPLSINYKDGNQTKQEVSLIGVVVNSETNIDLSLDKPYIIKNGQDKISVKVVNKGLGQVKFLEITLDSVSGIKFLSPIKVYIGNIDSNDFDTADFSVIAAGNTPSIVNVPILLKYSDASNKQFTRTESLSLRVYSHDEASKLGLVQTSNLLIYILIILAVVILFIIYRIIRKRRKKAANQ